MSRNHIARLSAVSATLMLSATALAAPWDNLAPAPGTVTSNNAGAAALIDQEDGPGNDRWHQSGDADVTPIKLDFVKATTSTVSYARMWNWTDPGSDVGGTAVYRLQSLNLGGNPALDADWTDIPGTTTVLPGGPPQFLSNSFAPVTTRGLRWLWTEDNNDAGNGNLRYTEFEYYSANVNQLDVTSGTHQGMSMISAEWTKTGFPTQNLLGGTPFNDNTTSRFDGPANGQQFVTMLWNVEFRPQNLRVFGEDLGQRIEDWTVEYLIHGGNPANNADWIAVETLNGGNPSIGVENVAMPGLFTRGIRLNIADPSTNAGHEILRLWEIEVFGIVPEPASFGLLLTGAMAISTRRRKG